jgi:glycosyltransferase involved in cell wall biosynthesis
MNISVLINSLNHGEFIEAAIKSALTQNYPRELYEIIVVDACSSDNTVAILEKYRDELKIVYQRGKRGLAIGCNMGIKASSGKYIVRLDADDVFRQNILYIESVFLDENNDIDFVYPDYFVNRDGIAKRVYLPHFDPDEIRQRGDFLGVGTMYRRRIFDVHGYYDENLKSIENYELILRLLNNDAKGLHIPLPLWEYRLRDDSMSSNKELMLSEGKKLERRYGFKYRIGKNHPRNIEF